MSETVERRRPWDLPAHPYLFAVFVTLFLYARNVGAVRGGQVAFVLVGTFAVAGAVHAVAALGVRSARRSALIASTTLLLFFSFGHVVELTRGVAVAGQQVTVEVLWGVWALLTAVGVILLRRAEGSREATRIGNTVASGLVVLSLVSIITPAATGGGRLAPPLRELSAAQTSRPRDIYVIVLDRYAGGWTLDHVYGFRNDRFLDGLRQRGFGVASASLANYQNTTMSLASTLNMQYLDWLGGSERTPRLSLAHASLRDHLVGRTLIANGYTYHHIGSWWDPGETSPIAHRSYRLDPASDFSRLAYETTLAASVLHRVGVDLPYDFHAVHRSIALRQFRLLQRLSSAPGPKFVLAHVLLPHPPYVFGADGSAVQSQPVDPDGRIRGYVDQLRYTNERLTALVDRLLDVPEDQRPVIALLSDEGPFPVRTGKGPTYSWLNEPFEDLREKFPILTAVHLPGASSDAVSPTLSPVNVFRLIFNTEFGTDLEMLDDRSFVAAGKDDAFTFVDITDRLRRAMSSGPG